MNRLFQRKFIKHYLALMACISAVLCFSALNHLAQVQEIKLTTAALKPFSENTTKWLHAEEQRLTPLLKDNRLAGTATDGLDNTSRQALYHFRFTQSVQDVYLYDSRAGQLMRAPESLPLPSHVLNYLRDQQFSEFTAILSKISNAPFLITATPLNYPEARPRIYGMIAQPLTTALKPLIQSQPSIKQYHLGLIHKNPTHQIVTHIHQKHIQLLTAPNALYTNSFSPHREKLTLPNISGYTLSQAIPGFPEWQISISSMTSNASSAKLILLILILLLFVLTLIYSQHHLKVFLNKLRWHRNKNSAHSGAKPYYNTASFTAPSAKTPSHDLGRQNSPTHAIPTPERILASLRPTGHLKTWTNVQDSLKKDRTVLLYQPIVDTQTQKPIMYEIFLRILDKDDKQVPPNKFLPAMEHYHAAGKIDTHVLEKVINTHFYSDKAPSHAFTINLTGQAFDAATFMTAMMEKLPTNALQHLGFELRHHEIRKDGAAKKFMNECLDMGIPLSVNYFGGGKSMLQVAKKMGFSYVKVTKKSLIDEGFSLAQMAEHGREIGIDIVLERIETEEECEEAKACGVPYVQGYFISKPAEWADVIK